MEISVIIPAYNEEDTLNNTIEKLIATLRPISSLFELIFVNDGSTDKTSDMLDAYSKKFTCVQHLNLSRNFGKEAAMSAGLEAAKGECVIIIDADLQHPPELIFKMYEKWQEGYDVINAVKRSRGQETFFYKLFAGFFNSIMSKSTGMNYTGASDYKLLDRQVVDALVSIPERNKFFRGLVAWLGFNTYDLPFDVQERAGGDTKWGTFDLVRYSVKNMVSFSSWPLLFIAYSGFCVVALGLVLLAQTFVNYFLGQPADGFTTVISLQILLSGMILFSLGIIAIYLAKIYDELKSRPIAVLKRNRSKKKALDND